MRIDGSVFKAARGLLGWTQADIAAEAGVSVSYVKYLETTDTPLGDRARPKALSVLSVFTNNGIVFVVLEGEVRGVVQLSERTDDVASERLVPRDISRIVPFLFIPEA